jgi:hypothetical protein|tara:strand:- start:1275 stop:1574 length:300 start_codon:yes stop_codon:yes gene_type:complete
MKNETVVTERDRLITDQNTLQERIIEVNQALSQLTTEKETLETNIKVLTGAIQTCNFLLQAEEKGEEKEPEKEKVLQNLEPIAEPEISKDKEKKTTEKK